MFDINPKDYFREAFKTAGWDRVYKKGEIIHMDEEPGEYIYFIIKGKVAHIIHDNTGKERVILIMDDGDIFGEVTLFEEKQNLVISETMDDSVIKKIPKAEFAELLNRDNGLYLAVIKLLSQKFRWLIMDIIDLSFENVYGRVATYLLMLMDRYGEKDDRGITIGIKLSQNDISRMVGASRVSVTKVMEEFSRLGILEVKNKMITIKSPEQLKSWANLTVEKLID
ncbi:Crp/Fnr family transcriptional regulator [Calorimonas adulescens]|uniref:Crp/Fnr family transcriptional regulator n=1 Tax=Calorimonas adulescens TaxID=2606906 RepID=A0A5D8QE11_9THEO|nr:Crp/Fnr family transcriptional regulator [Calorimonas adulescens]TZE82409.1 Crp/Fnr family transcriptional regulator [Calorimonas adulescens]